MANELVKVELYGNNNDGDQRRYTIADGTACSKGMLLTLIDPRIASKAILTSCNCAGVAAIDHNPNEGSTSVSCWTNGIFEAACSGAIACGSPVAIATYNAVKTAATISGSGALMASGAQIIGYALEAGDDLEIINIRILL